MQYHDFVTAIRLGLQTRLGADYCLKSVPMERNNGVCSDGLAIHFSGTRAAPAVYLTPYYACYQTGSMSIPEILDDIQQLFPGSSSSTWDFGSQLTDFKDARPRIMMRLIHAASNQAMLAQMPHIPYLDLAIIFYLFLEKNKRGQITTPIRQEHLALWHTDSQALLSAALQNTPREFPSQFCPLQDALANLAHDRYPAKDENQGTQPIHCANGPDHALDAGCHSSEIVLDGFSDHPSLYVLTNQSGIYGASCLVYPGLLKQVSQQLHHKNLVIIPCSIHELLIAPYDNKVRLQALNQMVIDVNGSEVLPEERLSDHVYLYQADTDQVCSAPITPQVPTASFSLPASDHATRRPPRN